jgi:hypothetical protein
VIVGIFLRHAFADHERQERIVKQSSLSWTIARPPHMKEGPRTGEYQHGFPATYPSMGATLKGAGQTSVRLFAPTPHRKQAAPSTMA